MEKIDINSLRKKVKQEYLNKGYELKNNKIFGLSGGKKCEVNLINNPYGNINTYKISSNSSRLYY